MKNFSKVDFACVGHKIIAFLTICVLAVAVPACAEPERYDFPKESPIKFVQPMMPLLADSQAERRETHRDASSINEAKMKSIAAFLKRHNRRLADEEAHDYATLIMKTCEEFGQNPFLIAAVVVTESTARSNAVSSGGDYGLMQIRWRVHEKKIRSKYPHITNAQDILNPKVNLMIGTEIFSVYHATAQQDDRRALLFYSGGNRRHADRVFRLVTQLEKSYQERLKNI